MKVLLTRAAVDAARTRAAIERLGHEVVLSPVISIEPKDASWPGGTVDALVATSAHAFLSHKTDWGPPPHVRRVLPLALVGERTKAAARSSGFLGPAMVEATSMALLTSIRAPWRRVVYAAGRDRKPTIEGHCAASEIELVVLETYAAIAADRLAPEAVEGLSSGAIHAVMHFSARSAQVFCNLVPCERLTRGLLCFCLSEEIAEPLRAMGLRALSSDEPSEKSLLKLLAEQSTELNSG